MRKTTIKVRWQFEGFHYYGQAPEEVSFLKEKHRHLFKCSAEIEVTHNDRELEFFLIQRKLKQRFQDGSHDFKSCEMIAHDVVDYLIGLYGDRWVEVEISEDGENSALVEFCP